MIQSIRKSSAKQFGILVFKYAIAIGALTYLIFSGKLQWSYFIVTAGKYHLVAVAVFLQLLVRLVSFVRYKILLQGIGLNMKLWEVVRIGFIGTFFSAFMFGNIGGDMVKLTYVIKQTRKGAGATASIMADRVLGLLGLLTLGGFAIFWYLPEVIATPSLQNLAITIVGILVGAGFSIFISITTLSKGRKVAGLVWLGGVLLAIITVAYLFHSQKLNSFGSAETIALLHKRMLTVLIIDSLVAFIFWIFVPILYNEIRVDESFISRIPLGKKIIMFIRSIVAYKNNYTSLIKAFAISIFIQFIALISLYLFSQAVQLEITPTLDHIFFAAPLAIATNNLPLPGSGLGVGEAAFDQILSMCRTSAGEVIRGGAGIFLLARCWGILLSLIGLPLYFKSKPVLCSESECQSETIKNHNSKKS